MAKFSNAALLLLSGLGATQGRERIATSNANNHYMADHHEVSSPGRYTATIARTNPSQQTEPVANEKFVPTTAIESKTHIGFDIIQIRRELEGFGITQSESTLRSVNDVYVNGEFAAPIVELILSQRLPETIPKGATVRGMKEDGNELSLTVWEETPKGSPTLVVEYRTRDTIDMLKCSVSALDDIHRRDCLAFSGEITIVYPAERGGRDPTILMPYVSSINKNDLSLSSLSQQFVTEYTAEDSDVPFDTLQKYQQYYGSYDFANEFAHATLNQRKTTFQTGNDMDLSFLKPNELSMFMDHSIKLMNIWMVVASELEHTVSECQSEHYKEALKRLDQAAAFFSGTPVELHGEAGEILKDLLDTTSEGFGVVGATSNNADSVILRAGRGSSINHIQIDIFDEIISEMNLAQKALVSHAVGGTCADVSNAKDRILKLWTTSLVQGILENSYPESTPEDYLSVNEPEEVTASGSNTGRGSSDRVNLDRETIDRDVPSEQDRQKNVIGAAYAAAILPFVHACDASSAEKLLSMMGIAPRMESPTLESFSVIKELLENNYECMGIKCADIGGLIQSINVATGEAIGYREQATPCGVLAPETNKNNNEDADVPARDGTTNRESVRDRVQRGRAADRGTGNF